MRFSVFPFAFLPLTAIIAAPVFAKTSAKSPTSARRAPQKIASKPASPAAWKVDFDEETLEAAWTWTSRLQATGAFETRVVFGAKTPDDGVLLRVVGDERAATLSFWRVRGGRLESLGEAAATIVAPRGEKLSGELSVQRSAWHSRALWNGRVVLSAWGELPGDRWGIASRGAAQVKKIAGRTPLQSTEAPVFSDDFMRAGAPGEAEAPGQWRRVSGVWKTSGLLGPRADAALNPNPFVFRAQNGTQSTVGGAQSTAEAATTVGSWWWSDYAVMSAVRPTLNDARAPLVAGLGAYAQSDGTRISGEVDFRSGRATIRRGGEVLVTSAPFEAAPNQWHRLYLEPGPGTIRFLVDGIERARVDTGAKSAPRRDLAQGPAALIGRANGANFVDFDDVRVAPNAAISDDFRNSAPGRWDDVKGNWQSSNGRRSVVSKGVALALTGGSEREEGLVEATFIAASKPNSDGVGVVFAARDAVNYYLARWRGTNLEIVEFVNGSGKILGRAKISATSRASRAISAHWSDGVITASGGGARVNATVAAIPKGRVGAWADRQGASIALTSFRALGAAPGWGEAALPAQFQKDRLMKNWASNAAAWQRGGDVVRWHSGDFFGDAALSLALPDLAERAQLSLHLAADPAKPNSGARLDIVRATDGWKWTLRDGARIVGEIALPSSSKGVVRFVRRPLDGGRAALRVALDGKTLFNEVAATGADLGTKTGVSLTNIGAREKAARNKVFIASLTSRERGGRPFLGLELVENGVAEGQRVLPGVRIGAITGDSPASEAKLMAEDVIRSIDGRDVKSPAELVEIVRAKPTGTAFKLQIRRSGEVESPLDWENVAATTSHQLDYTFTGAPVDWRATQGRWEVAERWTCSPQWAFFVGGNAVNPTLWSRFATRGDYTFEAYLANPMDQTRGERSPTDLNLSVEGDGRDLASGYNFVFAGNGRSVNRIYRGDKTVAEKPFQMPIGVGDTHQDWFYVRLERRQTAQGLRFRYWVNGKAIFDYTDPNPFAASKNGGRIAFWTYNGGLSIARARLWYSELDSAGESAARGTLSAPPSQIALDSQSATNKNALGEWHARRDGVLHQSSLIADDKNGGRRAVRITNPRSGGDWTTFVSRTPFDAARQPNLRFDYRLPRGVRVNLYAQVDGRWREIVFSGDDVAGARKAPQSSDAPVANSPAIVPGASPIEMAKEIDLKMQPGRIVGVQADNKWHTANFDLLGALRAAGLPTQVEALAFAAPDDDYLRCGIGGNHLGATFWIANFNGATNKPAATVAALRAKRDER